MGIKNAFVLKIWCPGHSYKQHNIRGGGGEHQQGDSETWWALKCYLEWVGAWPLCTECRDDNHMLAAHARQRMNCEWDSLTGSSMQIIGGGLFACLVGTMAGVLLGVGIWRLLDMLKERWTLKHTNVQYCNEHLSVSWDDDHRLSTAQYRILEHCFSICSILDHLLLRHKQAFVFTTLLSWAWMWCTRVCKLTTHHAPHSMCPAIVLFYTALGSQEWCMPLKCAQFWLFWSYQYCNAIAIIIIMVMQAQQLEQAQQAQ